MALVVVSGALANKPYQGGEAWVRLSWVHGLKKLGLDVYFVEQIARQSCSDEAGRPCAFEDSINARYFKYVTNRFGLVDSAALIERDGDKIYGATRAELMETAGSADLLVNISGHLTWRPLLERLRRKAYIDIDPGFTQFWHADPGTSFEVAEHDYYFTIGENVGRPECSIPAADIPWRPIRQPVVLDDWPVARDNIGARFTTVANWRGPFGPVEFDRKRFGLKVHEFRKFIELPRRSSAKFELALNIHPDEQKDLAMLRQNGWQLVDPIRAADTPDKFRRYVQQSLAEFSVAQGIYVDTNSGWFSDRTVRYLASGKPVLVQDTGFSENLPVGEGLLAFRTFDEAIAGAESILANYQRHSEVARGIAWEYFNSDRVLASLLQQTNVELRGITVGAIE